MLPARRDFPQLDAMRAFAAFAVVGTHVGFWSGYYSHGLIGVAIQRLEVGVAIFFVLSGFLLSRPYLVAAHERLPVPRVGRYFRKRALRILPVYVVTVVAAMTLVAQNRSLGLGRWIENLLLVDMYRHVNLPQGLTQMWSLTVEVSFYVLLPLIAWFLVRVVCRDRWRPGLLLALLGSVMAGSLAWVLVMHSLHSSWAFWASHWLPSYATWFALGMSLAVLTVDSAPGRVSRALIAAAQDRASCWLAAAAVFVLVSTPLGGSPDLTVTPSAGQYAVRHVCYALVAILTIAPCVLGRDDSPTAQVLALPAVRHVGHLSYSLFCCHVILLAIAVPGWGFGLFNTSPLLLFAVIVAVGLAVSEVLYRLVELPAMSLASGRRATAPTSTPSETTAHS